MLLFFYTALHNIVDKILLPAKNTPITGMVQITEQARSSPQSVISLKLPLNIASPTGSVRILSEFVTISGHIKLFHVVTKVNIASVATVGRASGRAILKMFQINCSRQF